MIKIIVANRFFFPDESATSRMVTSLARGLAVRGHDVHVATSRTFHDRPGRLPSGDTVAAVRVHRVWTTSFGRARLWRRTLDYLSFHLGVAWCVRRIVKPGDIVVACTDPPLLSVTVMLATLGSRVNLVNWLHDPFPEAAGRLGVLDEKAFAFRLLCALRDLSLRRAERNVALSERMATHLAKRGIPAASLSVIRNWADGAVIRPIECTANPLRRGWGATSLSGHYNLFTLPYI